jgi:hypothetical protein
VPFWFHNMAKWWKKNISLNLRSIVEKYMENITNKVDAELIVDKCYASIFFNKVCRWSYKYVHWCEISGCHRLADGHFFSPRFVGRRWLWFPSKMYV